MSSEPPAVDVVRIMKDIRESIQRKRAEGDYAPEELESLAEVRYRAYAEAAELDPRLLERLLGPSHDWNIGPDYLVRTHRPGFAAQLVVLAKKAVRPLVRLYTDHLFLRQAQLNQYFLHLLHDSIHDQVRLQAEVQALRRKLEQLEAGPRGARPGMNIGLVVQRYGEEVVGGADVRVDQDTAVDLRGL